MIALKRIPLLVPAKSQSADLVVYGRDLESDLIC